MDVLVRLQLSCCACVPAPSGAPCWRRESAAFQLVPDSLSMAAAKRLRKELDEMAQNPEPFCTAGPVGDDLFVWQAVLTGPPDSPYDGSRFLL